MALEPITRQEQIIAGKDLEPITRMERFLKEYGGASSQKLLGELVLTSENCTYNGSKALLLDDEISAQSALLFDKVEKAFCTIFSIVSLAGTEYRVAMNYVSATAGDDSARGLQFFFINHPGDATLYTFGWTKTKITTNHEGVLQAVAGGYPLTLKVYAT